MEYQSSINGSHYDVGFQGKFSFSDNETVQKILTELKGSDCSEYSVNLAALENIDSAGLGMLLLINDSLTDSGKSVYIYGATGQVLKMLEISKFSEVMDIRS